MSFAVKVEAPRTAPNPRPHQDNEKDHRPSSLFQLRTIDLILLALAIPDAALCIVCTLQSITTLTASILRLGPVYGLKTRP